MSQTPKDSLGADAAAVGNAEPVASDQLSHVAPGFTPGPWRVIERSGMARKQYGDCVSASHYSRPGITDGRDSVCSCNGPHGNANAYLIAAAPDMYEVLRSLFYDGPVEVALAGNPKQIELMRARVFAALKKAEGK